ncbi:MULTISPECIES: cupin domain-containing protein [unclassified Burkholderia]|uniref:JmjC domain-containing protein n=1 Tax=unclassified Burkholderia TaxID=2613784 RepID=UPI000AC39FA8|nr:MULTISPECIES: cupin domain-containing protein [unclassified Burkholderia]
MDDYLNSHEGNLHEFVQGAKDGSLIDIPAFNENNGGGQKQLIANKFHKGATFKLSELEWRIPLFGSLRRSMEETFGGETVAKIFLTPPNTSGFSPHFDSESVFAVQLSGTKIWSTYPRIATNPRASVARKLTAKEISQPAEQFVLEPGDVLYLPAGTPHRTQCDGAMSLYVSIGLTPWTATDVIKYIVDSLSLKEPALPAPLFQSEPYCEILLNEAIERAATELKKVSAGKAWAHYIRSENSVRPRVNDQAFTNYSFAQDISATSLVRRNPCKLVEIVESENGIRLSLSDSTSAALNLQKQPSYLELPGFVKQDLEELISLDAACDIAQVPGALDTKSKIILVKELLKHGVLSAE